MRIKILKNPVVCGGFTTADNYRKAMGKLSGRWVKVETEYIFPHQYNTPPLPGISESGLRIFGRHVEKIDYEKDRVLQVIHQSMQTGIIRCHSYRHDVGKFVDLNPMTDKDIIKIIKKSMVT